MIKDKLDQLGLGAAQIIGLGTAFLFITGVSYYYGYYVVGLKVDWLINLLTTKELLISNIRLGAGFILALGRVLIWLCTKSIYKQCKP